MLLGARAMATAGEAETRTEVGGVGELPGPAAAISVADEQSGRPGPKADSVTGPALGKLISQFPCAARPDQTYALYLPSHYSSDRSWPVLYCFDPGAEGMRAIERFRPAAERYGYILAGSNNCRNGDWAPIEVAVLALVRDVESRFSVNPQRRYAAGFSGGARVACLFAPPLKLAGVVACGAAFPLANKEPVVGFPLFGAAGWDDFNYQELRRADALLEAKRVPHRVEFYAAGHAWIPEELATEALEWLELQALRAGSRPNDLLWLRELLQRRQAAVASRSTQAEIFRGYSTIIADFDGLADLSEVRLKAAQLAVRPEVQQARKKEEKEARREDEWTERLFAAVQEARAGKTRTGAEELGQVFGHNRLPGEGPFSNRGAEEVTGAAFGRVRRSEFLDTERAGDRSRHLRQEVAYLKGRGRKDAAARRALNAAFGSLFEAGRGLAREEKYDESREAFELCEVIHPDSALLLFELAEVHALLGDSGKARHYVDTAVAAGYGDTVRVEKFRELLKQRAGVVELRPFMVREEPVRYSSFGVSLAIVADGKSKVIREMKIRAVAPGSDAEYLGLKPGTRILSADGRKVTELKARFSADAELHRVFMERRRGDEVALEVLVPGEDRSRKVRLRESPEFRLGATMQERLRDSF